MPSRFHGWAFLCFNFVGATIDRLQFFNAKYKFLYASSNRNGARHMPGPFWILKCMKQSTEITCQP